MMAGPPELYSFVNKFINLWQSGNCARLAVKCQEGKASVNLHLQLGGDPPAKPPKPRPSPSRQRRSARRALARAEAAAANAAPHVTKADTAVQTVEPISTVNVAVDATVATENIVVQTDPEFHPLKNISTVNVAVDATVATKDIVVQTDPEFQPLKNILTVQASHQLPQSAGQADPRPGHDRGHPHHVVQDVFCPDRDYRRCLEPHQVAAQASVDEDLENYEQNRANVQKTLQMIDQALNFRR